MDHFAAAHSGSQSEALLDLTERAHDCGAGELSVELAERALRVTRGTDFAVARDCLDALLRRLDSALADELVVRAGSGSFRVGKVRTYDVWLSASGEGSCSCPDFAKASLGACKHLLAVVAGGRKACAPRALRWDPVRPFAGPGDWFERIWHDPAVASPRHVAAMFHGALDRTWVGERRREAVEHLLAACRRDPALAEPALLPLLERERDALDRRQAISARELDRCLRGLKQELFPYQREGVERFLGAGRLLLADDMGLG